MNIDTSKFIGELAERTKENYQFIKDKSVQEKLYEVTQLINSMYSLLVIPEEIFGVKASGDKNTEFAEQDESICGYESYRRIKGEIVLLRLKGRLFTKQKRYARTMPVCSFLYNLRNALCHDGIGFYPIQTDFGGIRKNRITDIVFETKFDDDTIKFIAVIDIDTLEKILYAVSDLYVAMEKEKSETDMSRYTNYFSKIMKDVEEKLPDYV